MSQTVRPSRPQDIGTILAALSPRMEQEMPLLLPGMPDQMRRRFFVNHSLHAIAHNRASTFLAANTPVCILALVPDGRRWATVTLATERFYARDFLKISKRHLTDIQSKLDADLVAHTMSDHPRAANWLAFLGFRPALGSDIANQPETYIRGRQLERIQRATA